MILLLFSVDLKQVLANFLNKFKKFCADIVRHMLIYQVLIDNKARISIQKRKNVPVLILSLEKSIKCHLINSVLAAARV